MRIFVAVKPFPLEEEIGPFLSQWQRCSFPVKWVERENIHLTLVFLGEIESKKLPQVFLAIKKGIRGISSFSIYPQKIVCFPNWRNPRVLALSFGGEIGLLIRAQRQIRAQLLGFGFHLKEGKKFLPHLTLGRIKKRMGEAKKQILKKTLSRLPLGQKVEINSVFVFQSQLFPQGPVYIRLKEFPLLQ